MSDHKKEFLDASNRRWESANRFWEDVVSERPDLKGKRVCFPSRGLRSMVAMTEDEVFKAPNSEVTEEEFNQERLLLQLLGKRDAGMPIPHVTSVGEQRTFFGMTRVKGQTLEREIVESLPLQEQQRLAKEIAQFNIRLSQSVTEDDARKMGLPVSSWVLTPEKINERLSDPAVQKALGENYDFCCRAASAYRKSFAEKQESQKRVFINADMNNGNILYDPETKKMSMIDLGGACFEYPDVAFRMFHNCFPPAFVDMMLEEYSAHQSTQITRKDIQLLSCMNAIFCLPDALEKQDQPLITAHTNRIAMAKEALGDLPRTNNVQASKFKGPR